MPTAFVPSEDQNYFINIVQTPPGASLAYTTEVADRAAAIIRQNDDVFGTFSVMGFSLTGGSSPNSGIIFAPLKPIDERTKKGTGTLSPRHRRGDCAQALPGSGRHRCCLRTSRHPGYRIRRRLPVHAAGSRAATPSATSTALPTHGRAEPRSRLRPRRPQHAFTSNDPQLFVTIDREKAKAIGVPLAQITSALGTYMGSSYVNDFDFNNRSYRVYVQADQHFRRNSQDLRQYYVRSNTGQMIPLDNLVSITETSGPQVINHYNIFRSAEIDGAAAPGLSSGKVSRRCRSSSRRTRFRA